MAFDFKKEYKEFYMPRNKPQRKRRNWIVRLRSF